jgi:hypothetical protein
MQKMEKEPASFAVIVSHQKVQHSSIKFAPNVKADSIAAEIANYKIGSRAIRKNARRSLRK